MSIFRHDEAAEKFIADHRAQEAAARAPRPVHPELPANQAARERSEAQRQARSPEAVVEHQRVALERQRQENAALTSWQRLRQEIADAAMAADQSVRGALERGDYDEAIAQRVRARELRELIRQGGELDECIRAQVSLGIGVAQ